MPTQQKQQQQRLRSKSMTAVVPSSSSAPTGMTPAEFKRQQQERRLRSEEAFRDWAMRKDSEAMHKRECDRQAARDRHRSVVLARTEREQQQQHEEQQRRANAAMREANIFEAMVQEASLGDGTQQNLTPEETIKLANDVLDLKIALGASPPKRKQSLTGQKLKRSQRTNSCPMAVLLGGKSSTTGGSSPLSLRLPQLKQRVSFAGEGASVEHTSTHAAQRRLSGPQFGRSGSTDSILRTSSATSIMADGKHAGSGARLGSAMSTSLSTSSPHIVMRSSSQPRSSAHSHSAKPRSSLSNPHPHASAKTTATTSKSPSPRRSLESTSAHTHSRHRRTRSVAASDNNIPLAASLLASLS